MNIKNRRGLSLLTGALFLMVGSTGMAQEIGAPAEEPRELDTIRKVSNLLDADVNGQTGEKIASVEDLILDSQGRPQYIVLGAGGVLGIGEDHVAVPFRKLQTIRRGEDGNWTIAVPMTQEQIERTPTIKSDNYQVMQTPEWREQNATFFELEPADPADQAPGTMIRVTSLMDATVTNATGEALADVENLLLDREGRAAYAILGAGGVLGIGEEHLAVPFHRLNIGYDAEDRENTVSLATTREKLEAAPRMQADNYDSLRDADYVMQVNRYYVVDVEDDPDLN